MISKNPVALSQNVPYAPPDQNSLCQCLHLRGAARFHNAAPASEQKKAPQKLRNLRCEGCALAMAELSLAKNPASGTKRDSLPHNAHTSGTASGKSPPGTGHTKPEHGTALRQCRDRGGAFMCSIKIRHADKGIISCAPTAMVCHGLSPAWSMQASSAKGWQRLRPHTEDV